MSDDFHSLKGIVIALKANYFIVEVDNNKNNRLLCTTRNKLNYHGFYVIVGDFVFLESVDWNNQRAVITAVKARDSLMSRPSVANVTQIFVVLSLHQPDFDYKQASRFLLTAENTGLKVNLLLSKIDLISSETLKEYLVRVSGWGYKALSISTRNGEGIPGLLSQLKGSKLSVISGPSGVGKSSLLKSLLPKESLRIAPLSKKLQRGVHTTRHVELFKLSKDSFVADTPGFNMPELNITPKKLPFLFPEFRRQIKTSSCKFRDCLHREEPGCGFKKNWERYSDYRELLDQIINSHH